MRWTSYTKGVVAEYCAAIFMIAKGYLILEHRYKTPWGEIDLIARRGKTLVFIEVKRRKTLVQGMDAITPHQQRRIESAGKIYLASSKLKINSLRLDVIVVTPWRVHHLTDAWRAY